MKLDIITKPATGIPFSEYAEEVSFKEGDFVTRQYERADFIYLLLEGSLTFFIGTEESSKHLIEVGRLDKPNTAHGWSGLNAPYRYNTSIKVSSPEAKFLRWDSNLVREYAFEDDLGAFLLLKSMVKEIGSILSPALDLLFCEIEGFPSFSHKSLKKQYSAAKPSTQKIFLRKSPFFQTFTDAQLAGVRDRLERRQYNAGDIIYRQGERELGLFILESGWVDLVFEKSEKQVLYRSISSPGFIVGWSGALSVENPHSAFVRRDTFVNFLSNDSIDEIANEGNFSIALLFRFFWLASHHLDGIRTKYVSFKYNLENIAIKTLIDQNCTRLSLDSRLHQVPHLLNHHLTQDQAFKILHNLHNSDDEHERHIASLCLDNLQEVEKEHRFYHKLINVYKTVVEAPEESDARQLRKDCAKAISKAFKTVDYVIKGKKKLPKTSGHIFIYNHLLNHPHNTLPNDFQVTLDSHFISSLVLNEKYGDPGLRVVRIGRGIEFGHQNYYQRLGHIDVLTPDSGVYNTKSREAARQHFFEEAGKRLLEGENLIISPEGTSYVTEESPGNFKSGAFRLALSLDPEPLIVPIAIANFDKRARYNSFNCLIEKPFKVSDHISDPTDKEEMKSFLEQLRLDFKAYIREAKKIHL